MTLLKTAAGMEGPLMFARFALPPNQMGYCGPADSALGDYLQRADSDGGLRQLASAFDGAWPYLSLISQNCAIADPLDRRVVEAYWLGGPMVDRVEMGALGDSMRDRFSSRSGWIGLSDGLGSHGGSPTHAYHVFAVYPWLGLVRSGLLEPGLGVLDRCRIRWGTVLNVAGSVATVTSRSLEFESGQLVLGPERAEVVTAVPGLDGLAAGDRVALHWDWVCARLDDPRLHRLQRSHAVALDLANRSTALRRLAG